uniref:Uncharacterized protein n=1 Tax=Panagrolaimus sp. JU765 TaxID=591449 RepID=A0AC34Q5P0_9BILA
MRSAAKEADFEAILAEKLKTIDSPDLEAQICVVLRVLQGEIDVGRRKESDDDDEEDYIEAEIDSTDTLIPAMTELFGETLLQKKYMLAGQQPTIANEDAAPPGTVPRKLLPSVTGSKNVKYLLRKGVPPPLTNRRGYRDFGLPKEPIPAAPFTPPDQRLSSVASFATFVAENDKRKPLLALNGFNTAVTQWRHHQKKSAKKDLTSPEANSPAQRSPKKVPEPLKLSEVPKYRHRRKSESSVDEEAVNQHHPPLKATSSATLTELKKSADVAPVVGRINSRVPEDANVNEYAAVFGSRPKIARTPENTSGKQKNTVFMF